VTNIFIAFSRQGSERKMKYIGAMIVLFSLANATTAFAGTKSVVVTNNTSYTMTEFYASSSDSATWTINPLNNLLIGLSGLVNTLLPGAQTTINIIGTGGGEDGCEYDLMAVLQGATQAAYTYSVNTCDGGSWSIAGM
jgi:hypothetical protein